MNFTATRHYSLQICYYDKPDWYDKLWEQKQPGDLFINLYLCDFSHHWYLKISVFSHINVAGKYLQNLDYKLFKLLYKELMKMVICGMWKSHIQYNSFDFKTKDASVNRIKEKTLYNVMCDI